MWRFGGSNGWDESSCRQQSLYLPPMRSALIKAIIILPGTALVFVPALILWLSAGSSMAMSPAGLAQTRFWIGLVVAVVGLVPAAWSARLFLTNVPRWIPRVPPWDLR